ncbi:MAG: hypothetical protein JXB50_13855 [Spirochaetes bacterium]|nr:hypothetical protein [Spirochaetota bacterium]
MKFSVLIFFKNDNYVFKIYINSIIIIILTAVHILMNSRITINWFFVLCSFAIFFALTIIIKIFYMKSILKKEYKMVKGRVLKYKHFGVLEYNPHIIVELNDNSENNDMTKTAKKIFTGLFNKYNESDEVVLLLYKNNFILKDNAYV